MRGLHSGAVNLSTNLSTKAFTISQSAQLFHSMIKSIYVNPEEAMVRELINNGLDSGATKIVVNLPSTFYPVFSVQDNGCGMSDDFVQERYSCIGDSTKMEIKAEGYLGLGGKIPAYVSSDHTYQLECRTNNEKRNYIIVSKEGSVPLITQAVHTVGTFEPGVTVSCPIRKEDVSKIREALVKKLWFCDLSMFEILGDDSVIVDVEQLRKSYPIKLSAGHIKENPRRSYYGNETTEHYALMGTTVYSIPKQLRKLYTKHSVVLFLPMDSCNVQVSRESLFSNDKTAKALDAAYDKLKKEVEEYIQTFTIDMLTFKEDYNNHYRQGDYQLLDFKKLYQDKLLELIKDLEEQLTPYAKNINLHTCFSLYTMLPLCIRVCRYKQDYAGSPYSVQYNNEDDLASIKKILGGLDYISVVEMSDKKPPSQKKDKDNPTIYTRTFNINTMKEPLRKEKVLYKDLLTLYPNKEYAVHVFHSVLDQYVSFKEGKQLAFQTTSWYGAGNRDSLTLISKCVKDVSVVTESSEAFLIKQGWTRKEIAEAPEKELKKLAIAECYEVNYTIDETKYLIIDRRYIQNYKRKVEQRINKYFKKRYPHYSGCISSTLYKNMCDLLYKAGYNTSDLINLDE